MLCSCIVISNYSFANLIKDGAKLHSVKSKLKLGLDIIILFCFENSPMLLI